MNLWPDGLELLRKNKAGSRTRTDDLLITNQLLYQLSYTGTVADPFLATLITKVQAQFSPKHLFLIPQARGDEATE